MDKETIKSTIKQFLESELKRNIPSTSTNLINAGFLDSFTIIKLITFIESNFNLTIDIDSANEDSFSSIDTLAEQIIIWKEKV